MPLSEHEQRILAELEESLARHDPRFVARVRSKTVYRQAGRQLKWAVLGFIAGLAVLVAFYSDSVAVGLIGVAIMFASAVIFERNLRRVGKASWQDFTRSRQGGEEPAGTAGPAGTEHAVHGTREWLRTHLFRRDH